MKQVALIGLYLVAIVLANLSVSWWRPTVSIVNAFVFIGLDLTCRDYLHDMWRGRGLWLRMFLLVAFGSVLSYVLNQDAANIALASFLAFLLAGVVDTVMYFILGEKSKLVRINGSNVISAVVDSLVFPIVAFGLPILWFIVVGQFVAKLLGGFIWSIILDYKSLRGAYEIHS